MPLLLEMLRVLLELVLIGLPLACSRRGRGRVVAVGVRVPLLFLRLERRTRGGRCAAGRGRLRSN